MQSTHAEIALVPPVPTPYVPAGHGVATVVPAVQKLPCGQMPAGGVEMTLPTAQIYPALQIVQEIDPPLLYVPAGHCTGWPLVLGQELPLGQDMHPVPVEYVPAAHVEFTMPLKQDMPLGQGMHPVAPVVATLVAIAVTYAAGHAVLPPSAAVVDVQ